MGMPRARHQARRQRKIDDQKQRHGVLGTNQRTGERDKNQRAAEPGETPRTACHHGRHEKEHKAANGQIKRQIAVHETSIPPHHYMLLYPTNRQGEQPKLFFG